MMQHGENAPTCIGQYHSARYRRMQVGVFMHVHVDVFWPFTYVTIDGGDLNAEGGRLSILPYRPNSYSIFRFGSILRF